MEAFLKAQYKVFEGIQNAIYNFKNETIEFAKSIRVEDFDPQALWDNFRVWLGDRISFSENAVLISFLSSFVFLTWFVFIRVQIMVRARNCSVLFNWTDGKTPRVGEFGVLKITFLRPSFPESVSKLLKAVSVKVQLGHEEIVVEKDASEAEQSIFLKFQIHRSGMYEINILYEGYPVCGSPFTAIVDPDEMDPTKTVIDWAMPIVLTQGKMSTLEILPRDQYGNRCSARSDNLNRLSIELYKIPEIGTNDSAIPYGERDFKSSFSIRRDLQYTDRNLEILSLHLKFEVVGIFFGLVLYNGIELHTQELVIISISTMEKKTILENEHQERQFNLAHSTDFEASMSNGRNIIVELSPRFFYLKEMMHDGILPSRIATFRVCEQTVVKIQSSFQKDRSEMYRIQIIDQLQNQSQIIEMSAKNTRVLLVLISRFSNRDNDSMSLDSKRVHLFKQLRAIYNENPRLTYKVLKVRRSELVQSTLDETLHYNREDWGKIFVVSFYGEPVKTEGLAWLDWSESLFEYFFENNSHGMFCSIGSSGLVHPNPNRNPRWTRDHYELAGKVVGKYLVETALDSDGTLEYYTNARFTRSFLAQILSLKPTYKHMELDDTEMFTSTIEPILTGNVSGMNLTFTGPVYDTNGNMITQELIPNGNATPVTNENKITYLNALANLRLAANIQEEVEAFVSGLTILIPNDLLMTFDENELELVICGSSAFSLKEIQMYHVTIGTQWNPYIGRIKEWLWKCMQEMSPLDIGRFLQFVTGSSRLPPGGLIELNPRLKISVSCLFGQLPTSKKAQHQLYLTDHPTFEDFSKALITAIREVDKKL